MPFGASKANLDRIDRWFGIDRDSRNFLPFVVYNRNMPLWIDRGLVQRDAYGEHPRLLGCIVIVFTVRSRRVDQSMAVFDIEKVSWHEQPITSEVSILTGLLSFTYDMRRTPPLIFEEVS